MARRKRRSKSGRRRSGGGGMGSGIGGVFSRPVLGTIGGAVAAGVAVPMLSRFIPSNITATPIGRIAAAIGVGALGFMVLRRWSPDAAKGFAAAAITPEVARLIPIGGPAPARLAGIGVPDAMDYLPLGDDSFPLLEGEDELADMDDGMGAYETSFVDVDG